MMIRVWFSLLLLVLQARLFACARTWPGGKYSLLKPITGCPRGFHGRGFLFQDTEDTNPSNNRSDVVHIDGYFAKGEVLKYFCTKHSGTQYPHGTSTAQWPRGQYCIYSKDATLKGMELGSIRMYDEKSNNHDAFKIDDEFVSIVTSHTGIFCNTYTYDYTKLNFACKTNGNKKRPISLPIAKPFYLLPYGSRDCQQVKWMVATSEWIKYHTHVNSEESVKHETVPYVWLGNKNTDGVTMYYCYYESCWNILHKKRGVFQSPGFPGKYPDGQLCSWRIMVPDNHTLRVHFTHFSLIGSNTNDDYLRLSTKMNGRYRANETFYGVKQPFNITATSHVRFLFRSDEKSNSYGFRAEYHMFIPLGDYTERLNPNTSTTTPKPLPLTEETIQSTMQASANPTSSKRNNIVSTKSLHSTNLLSRQFRLITAIVIPLVFVTIGILLFIIILYRCRSKERGKRDTSDARESILMDQPKSKTAASTPKDEEGQTRPRQSCDSPEYESPGDLKEARRPTSHTDIDSDASEYHVLEPISNNVPDSDAGQIYQTLSRDQHPEYEAPNYSKCIPAADMNPDSPEYHELEPIGNDVPDVVYRVLEGPDSSKDGPSDDKVYQALDEETTHNPLYQHTSPVTMVTENPLYDFSEI